MRQRYATNDGAGIREAVVVVLRGNAAETNRLANKRGNALRLHLFHHLSPVAFDRARRNSKLRRNSVIAMALHDEIEHLDLAGSQPFELRL